VNTDKDSSVETEQAQREQKETRTTLPVWVPAPTPQVEPKEEQAHQNVESVRVEPEENSPQFSSELSFVCLLIPRFSDHYLIGDITESLVEWMKQICISYGWRLDAIAIRPGYMQWVIRVSLTANPAHFMKLVRRHTSEKIFDDFPRFKQKNLSGEFWAPGNLVISGTQLQPLENVNALILQTRRQQGIA
jgi:REP element-mobilizing transposase RayT